MVWNVLRKGENDRENAWITKWRSCYDLDRAKMLWKKTVLPNN